MGVRTIKRPVPKPPDQPLTCTFFVGTAVFWFRTSWSGVSRHAGLMSREIPG
jgi:hypothetical protein